MQLLVEVPCQNEEDLKKFVSKLKNGLVRKHMLEGAIFVLGQKHWVLKGVENEPVLVSKDVIVVHGVTSSGGHAEHHDQWRHYIKTEFENAIGITTIVM